MTTTRTKDFNGTRINLTTGSEGPAHDPYGVTTITVERNGQSVECRAGLGVHLLVNEKQVEGSEEELFEVFEDKTGMHFGQAAEYYYKAQHRKRSRCVCGSHHIDILPGYPGETFYTCSKCGEVLGYDFDRSAIE